MKIHIYKLKADNRFYICINRGEDGFRFNLTPEELQTLYDEISKELGLNRTENETKLVWNPRSQRHELVKK